MADLFQLWAFTPGSNTATILPRPLAWSAGFALSDVSSMQLTYPLGQPGIDVLDGYCDIEVRYWDGTDWICPPQGRFSVADRDQDPVGEQTQPSRTYTCISYSWLLGRVYQEVTTGLDAQGNRPFADQSYGQVAATLIGEAKANGAVPELFVENSAGTGGSSPAFPVGKALLDILADGRDQGLLEWLMQPTVGGYGRKLQVYSTVGVDRTTGGNPVTLRLGLDLTAAPSKVSIRDIAGATTVAGDGGRYLRLTNPGADTPYGILSSYTPAGGLSTAGAMQIVAQATLDKGSKPRAQHTRAIIFDQAKWLPFQGYGLGDTILGPDETGALVALRVRQITITFDQQRGLSGNLVLGDRFTEHAIQQDRAIRQLTGGAGAISGAGRPPTTEADDPRKPAAPTGFNVGSTPLTAADGSYQAVVQFGWVNPTLATDGSEMDPGSVEVWGRKGTTGSFRRVAVAGFPDTSVDADGYVAGTVWQFKARAVSVNNKPGPYTAVQQVTLAKDTTPPPVPAAAVLSSRGGTLQIDTPERGAGGEVMPADYARTEVHVSTSAGFTPSASTLKGSTGAPGVLVLPNLAYDTTYYVKLIAVDRAGNKSAPSAQVSRQITKIIDIDLANGTITSASLSTDLQNQISTTGNFITRSTSDPSGTGKNGDTWEKWSGLGVNGRLLAFWRWSGAQASWVQGVIDPVYLPKVDIGEGTFGSLSGSRLIAYSVGANQLAANAIIAGKIAAGAIDGMIITGTTIRTAASGARVQLSGDRFELINGSGNDLVLFDAAARSLMLRSNDSPSTRGGFFMSDTSGILFWNSAGQQTVNIGVNGSATFSGPVVSGGSIIGSDIGTSATNPRVRLFSDRIVMTDASGNTLFQAIAGTGYTQIRSGTTGARFEYSSTTGLSLYNSGGTRTVFLNANTGDASFTGTVSASAINTSTFNGGTVSSATHSGGTYSGSPNVTGTMYASGSGVFRSSNGSTRVDMYGSQIDFVVNGSSANGATIQGTSGVGLNITGNTQIYGAVGLPLVFSNETTASANVNIKGDGFSYRLYRSTSSLRGKRGIQPIADPYRVLAASGVTWMDANDPSGSRIAGFTAESMARTGVEELVGRDVNGWPDAVNYDRIAAYHHEIIRDLVARVAALEAA